MPRNLVDALVIGITVERIVHKTQKAVRKQEVVFHHYHAPVDGKQMRDPIDNGTRQTPVAFREMVFRPLTQQLTSDVARCLDRLSVVLATRSVRENENRAARETIAVHQALDRAAEMIRAVENKQCDGS